MRCHWDESAQPQHNTTGEGNPDIEMRIFGTTDFPSTRPQGNGAKEKEQERMRILNMRKGQKMEREKERET